MMIKGLYFPVLNRQLVTQYYKKGSKEFYATYNCQHNYENVALDCQNRCVYCDVHVDECGGEKFSLDHFRPKNIFGEKFDGILNTHPFNLHLSCQKCNVLKSDDWKGCEETQDGETYLSKKGYIDRFQVDASDYFDVNDMGQIVSINDEGPGDYMIGRLLLNRTNRVHIRKLREVKLKIDRIKDLLAARQNEVLDNWNSGVLSEQQAKEKIGKLTSLLSRFAKL
ncbi:HNH endonuclease [Vibrio metoecus]